MFVKRIINKYINEELTSRYADTVMKTVSPLGVTLLSNTELCSDESHAASKRNTVLSSPGYSRYSPGNSPRDNTEVSLSSSSLSGVLRMRPNVMKEILNVVTFAKHKQRQIVLKLAIRMRLFS